MTEHLNMPTGNGLRVAPHVAWTFDGEHVVLADLRTSLRETLNGSASRVWELVAEGLGWEQLLRQLADDFPGAPPTFREEAAGLVRTLINRGILQRSADTRAADVLRAEDRGGDVGQLVDTGAGETAGASSVSELAWSELLRAEVSFILAQAGIPVLHIKGPTVALWLYEAGERPWGDADILVPPSRLDEALDLLMRAGMAERHPGVNRHTTLDHAITLVRPAQGDLGTTGWEIDVHDRFEGIAADFEFAFSVLWRRREPVWFGHVICWVPDPPARSLLVAINVARSRTTQSLEDLRRLVATATDADWQTIVQLAASLEASSALRAGLELDVGGRRVAQRHLAGVTVTPEWTLRVAGAPRTAVRLVALRPMTWGQRVKHVAQWLAPSPAVMRMRDPAAASGRGQLALAYLRRLRDGARSLPGSVRALRAARLSGRESRPS